MTTDENTGDVAISWTTPVLDPCGAFTAYVLYGATSLSGPFLLIDSIINPTQTGTLHVGANGTILDWYYFIFTVQNCPGATSVHSDTVQEEPLITPDLDFVTVTSAGVQINWFPSPSTQTEGYIIYYDLGGGLATEVDTVFGINTTTYLDVNADPNASSVAYTIAAFDGCNNKTLFNDSEHRTIFLTASVQQCAQQVTLNWNPYINWNPGVSAYRVEASVDGAAFAVSQTLPDGSAGYLFPLNSITGDSICFRITAVHQNGITASVSNIVCLSLDLIRSTTFNFVRRVSVNAADGVDVEWYIDTAANINSYFVQRSPNGNSFSTIDTLPVSTPVFLNSYADTGAPTQASILYYRIGSYDDCNFQLNSTIGRTILLTGTGNGVNNTLNWNAFELDHATVTSYTIYRIQNGVLVPLQSVGGNVFTFSELVGNAVSEDGTFCYVIEADYQLDIPGFPTESLKSASNEFCLFQTPVIYVPNAFVPKGKNTSFKPTLLNPNVSEYEFKIFDRWGKVLFETTFLNEGWDGSNNGEEMPLGGYAYYIKVVSRGGVVEERTGMVVLVR